MRAQNLLFTIALFALTSCKNDPSLSQQVSIEVFVKNLEVPWGMAFLPNGDFIFCERNGNINLLKEGETEHTLLMHRNVVVSEGGLLGLAPDPAFSSNHYVYIYETTDSNRVVRLLFNNDDLTEDKVILGGIPKAQNHDGGALRFGPDGYLYVGTGDALIPPLAQDKNSLAGKILRIDREGNAAAGNPFNTRIWTYGHRNIQGFDWNKQGKMIATEHGPSGEFGWCCHDEINLIEPGKNYGWPLVIGDVNNDTLTDPLYHSGDETWAPSGCTFIEGEEWKDWENNFVLAGLRSQRLIRFKLNASGDQVISKTDTLAGQFQRLRNIIQAPDGSYLFTSSNIGTANPPPLADDDKIYRMYVK